MTNHSRKAFASILPLAGLLNSCYTGVDLGPTVYFDLPSGWEIIAQVPKYTAVTAHSSSKDGIAPLVKLETSAESTFNGDEQDARDYIENSYKQEQKSELPSSWPESEFKTLTLPSGVTVYANIRPDIFWAHDEKIPWSSVIAYSREDHVIVMYLGDRADLYMSELDIITHSTKIIAN
jgi:hypothetical protein